MKRLAIVASLFVFAACAPKAEETKPADAAAMAAPAAAMSDSTDSSHTAMKADISMMKSKADSGMKKM